MKLSVPAQPAALSVVRVVLMSFGALNGATIDQIVERSKRAIDSFASLLVQHPDAKHVELRTLPAADDVDLVPVRDSEGLF